MARTSKSKDKTEVAVADAPEGVDLSPVLPLSLLAGGLAAYPSLSAVAEGDGDLMGALTLFLGVTLVATIGFGIVAFLFHSFTAEALTNEDGATPDRAVSPGSSAPRTDPAVDEVDGPVPTVALAPGEDPHADAIDTALAPTDALVHDQP